MLDINSLVRQKRQTVGNTLFLSIDGHGGSGKSTLADILASKINAVVIHTDDFASIDNPTDWASELVHSVFRPIELGRSTLSYQRSKWWPDHRPEPVLDQRVSDFMILEGVGSSQIKLRKYLGLSIFMDTPTEICLQRGIARDLKTNAGSEEEIREHWKRWIEEEMSYFNNNNPKQYAEIIVDGTIPFSLQIK